jgi:hypothetical protein
MIKIRDVPYINNDRIHIMILHFVLIVSHIFLLCGVFNTGLNTIRVFWYFSTIFMYVFFFPTYNSIMFVSF